ncbi:endonuclease [Streptomyces sp. NPDC006283]|uniref:endonuclease n=1 Tax=Streptomyces sp. NPDC006283 TaxID=3156741 RepID=UPI0033AF12D1
MSTQRAPGLRQQRAVLHALLDDHGRTYAEEAGIKLRDTPQPLYRLLVLAHLLSARIRASVAVAAAGELNRAGMRSAQAMAQASWQDRVDALGRGGYRRYDERTATQLGDGAELLIERYGGDLRRMRERAGGDVDELRRLLRDIPGIGPAGVDIFLREVQCVWPETGPLLDEKALQGARRLGVADDPRTLLRLADDADAAHLAAGLVRAALDKELAGSVKEHAAA